MIVYPTRSSHSHSHLGCRERQQWAEERRVYEARRIAFEAEVASLAKQRDRCHSEMEQYKAALLAKLKVNC
ncbi:hypothetical protein KIPB_004130 [Kipferlia bialata]|uniref:Uncharacterized protein n=1 Tax=Kipferlia bialata TaxID=797122 RepID=A0A9K3CTG5_9EUKA|nr:hypothetical protein KIPB_004130 [Kipferlia bialata]|eukprot:g4130.t1